MDLGWVGAGSGQVGVSRVKFAGGCLGLNPNPNLMRGFDWQEVGSCMALSSGLSPTGVSGSGLGGWVQVTGTSGLGLGHFGVRWPWLGLGKLSWE